jgi:hypothetical protein
MKYYHEKDDIGVTAGSIDEKSVKGVLPKPSKNIFLAEKAWWYDLPDDGTGRYSYHTENFQKSLDALKKTDVMGGP